MAIKGLKQPLPDRPEIDLILEKSKYAFEIKYGDNVRPEHMKNLAAAPDDFKLFLITRDTYDKTTVNGRNVLIIPLWMFCLFVRI